MMIIIIIFIMIIIMIIMIIIFYSNAEVSYMKTLIAFKLRQISVFKRERRECLGLESCV
jgi:predicted Holliday junction resolvase-like endonuclease